MNDTKNVYGVYFPLPSKMRKITKYNQHSQIQEELCDIIEKMEKATDYFITLSNLSITAQEVLSALGYTIIVTKDHYIMNPYYRVEWYDKETGDEDYA